MSTPCNNLNVQLIKVSQLGTYSSLKDADILMIVENTGGSKYSRNSTLSSLRSYILDSGVSGFPSISFKTNTDVSSINSYTSGTVYSYTHSLGSTPALVRVVLYCNSTDGTFSSGDEIDVLNCINNNNLPFATVTSNNVSVKVSIPSYSSVKVYSKSTPIGSYSLNKLNWQIKIYAWK